MIIAWIDEVDNTDLELVGGKGASLGELKQAKLPVPDAFVVTAETFRRFIVDGGIDKEIFKILDETNVDNSEELQKASQKIKEIIIETETPEDIRQEVNKAYEKISEKAEGDNEFVAIRSSATAEDLPDASFAGQQETFLNIRGQKNVMEKIKECWASLYTARAIFYREKQNFEHSKVNIAVVVQRMVNAEKAGVIFTSHPTTGEDEVIIEAGWGLGEGVVSGSVSPDHYIINKKGFEIKKRDISTKRTMFDRDPETGETRHVDVPEDMMDKPTLTDEEITELAKMGEGVEKHYKTPQDVEWAIEDNEIYMLQSRPITTITDEEVPENEASGEIIVEGLGASPGIGAGTVKIVKNLDELDKVKEGDILVTSMTTPDMVPAMKKASAIVTDEGGLTCHAAIVSRELSTPAVVGANGASKTLKDGEEVTVDGEKGKIYKGKIKKEKTQKTEKTVVKTENNTITATDIKVNVSIPEAAERAAQTGADGVGLLRIEHLVLGLNRHPQSYAEKGEQEEFIRELENGIRKVADEFYPKPVWIRTLDAPTDEFRSLEGGDREPKEHNPMLGFRGIRRDLKYTEIFEMQIKAIKKLIKKGYTNLGLMLPLIQHPKEVKQAKEMMKEHKLDLEKIDFGIMVETPAASLIIEDIIKEDIDFISFGTNDLTQYTLAVDRNNERVSGIYDERHPAVLKLMERVIEKCNEADVKTSICGQAGSYPDIVDRLVKMGITSVSANIDSVREIRKTVAKKEKQILLDSIRK